MKTMAKAALGALALVALGAGATSPANAQTSFGFSFGSGPYYGDYRGGYGNPCYSPYRYRPAYCFRRGPGYGYYGRPSYRRYGYYDDYRYRGRRPYWR